MGPDAIGSIAFLTSSYLAFVLVCRAPWCWLPQSPSWGIATCNLAGSVAFGLSAVGAFVIPATGEVLDERWANAGTFAGAAGLLVGACCCSPDDQTALQRPGGQGIRRQSRGVTEYVGAHTGERRRRSSWPSAAECLTDY